MEIAQPVSQHGLKLTNAGADELGMVVFIASGLRFDHTE